MRGRRINGTLREPKAQKWLDLVWVYMWGKII